MRCPICVTLLTFLCARPLAALAGPPFITDDPDPVDYQHFEVVPFYAMDRGQNSAVTQGDVIEGPGVDFNYGIFPQVQLNLQGGFIHALPVMGTPAAYGFGDFQVAVKWRFLQESDDHPSMAIYPAVIFPTGNANRDLGNGQASYNFPLWIEKNWDAWTSYGGVAYALNRAPGQRDHFYGGWELQRNFGDSLYLGGEIYSQASDAQTDPGYTLVNLGGGVTLNSDVSFIFTAGHSIAGGSHAVAYVGLFCTWGP